MKNAKELLIKLTEAFPPDDERRHGIMLNDDGELEIQLALNNQFQPVVITGDSLDSPAGLVAIEVGRLIRELP